jgi:fumarate reductase (CoM/CoB) subunit A
MSTEVDQVIETDVLIAGGGIAGSRAAIEADRSKIRTFIVIKGIFGASGCSLSPSTASAIGPWSAKDDSVELHFKDMVVQGKQYLCNQQLLKVQAEGGGEVLAELEQWGYVWDRDTSGHISLFPSSKLFPGVAAHDRWITFGRRGASSVGPFWTGHAMVDILRDEVNRRKIPYVQETIISRILLRDSVVCGALGYDYCNAQPILFKCKAFVLATGDYSQVYFPHTMVSRESTGDGFGLAYDAGASLVNLEQFEYISLMNAYPDSARGKAALESPAESGQTAYLRNSLGERFMERYNKKMMELASQEDLAKAIDIEVKEGRGGPHGGCFLDLRHIPREVVVKSAPGRLEHIERLGYDISKDLIEVYPVVHTTTGGIRINERCETGVPGLYAAGQVAFAVSDCLGEGATGIVDAVFWGKIAGQNAATYSQSKNTIEPEPEQVRKAIDELLAPLRRKTGPTPLSVIRKLQHVMWDNVGIVKNQTGLEKAESEIKTMKDTLSTVSTKTKTGRFNLEMLEAIELRHMLIAAEAIVRSSLERKESRNRFHRSDYPKQDNKNWLKHIIITKSNEGMNVALEPVEFPYLKPEAS